METAELRVVFGKNILDLSDDEVSRAAEIVAEAGLRVVSIASPLLKCVLPDAPEVDARFQQDIFASRHTFEDQPRLTERAFDIADRLGAKVVRVFSYWRVVKPEAVFERVVDALGELAAKAGKRGLIIGLENEHACNIATGMETARALSALDHPNLQIVWDPANAFVSGEEAFPTGYSLLSPRRIAHVHAKNCRMQNHHPVWGPLDDGAIDWRAQIAALARDGYQGCIHLETHWPGPNGDKHLASMICGKSLVELATV